MACSLIFFGLCMTTGTALGRSGRQFAAPQPFMAADTAAMKRTAGIRQGWGRGPMTLPAGLAHFESCRSMMTDDTVRPFARGVTAVVERHGAGARRQLDGGGRDSGREQRAPQESTPQHRVGALQFLCQASKSASASSAATVTAAIARAIHKRMVVASSDQVENFEVHTAE